MTIIIPSLTVILEMLPKINITCKGDFRWKAHKKMGGNSVDTYIACEEDKIRKMVKAAA